MKPRRRIVLIAHNVRSTHNVGSLLRTAEGLGVERVILTGYTPYPQMTDDPRLPHISTKIDMQIHKTALGAEKTMVWQQHDDVIDVINELKVSGFVVCALEQTEDAVLLPDFKPPIRFALLVGREVEGIEPEILSETDSSLEIPMYGIKESYNVAQAAAMALYHIRFIAG